MSPEQQRDNSSAKDSAGVFAMDSQSKPRAELRRVRSVLIFGATMAIVIWLDHLTKRLVLTSVDPGDSIPVIEGFFNIVLAFNRGAAFGFLANVADGTREVLLFATTFLALALVLYFLIFEYFHDLVAQFAIAMILGGAVGNLIDRIRFGVVVDFLDFYIGDHHWPAFNVADSAICMGVAILILRKPFRHGVAAARSRDAAAGSSPEAAPDGE